MGEAGSDKVLCLFSAPRLCEMQWLDRTLSIQCLPTPCVSVLRHVGGNVKAWTLLLRDTSRGLALPLPVVSFGRLAAKIRLAALQAKTGAVGRPLDALVTCAALALSQVYATEPIKPGEELILQGLREQELKAQARLERKQSAGRSTKRAQLAADHQANLLRLCMQQQLVQSGWRQHMLDVFVQRHFTLAGERAERLEAAAEGGGSSAAQCLRRALRQARKCYNGGGKLAPSSTLVARRRIQSALEASLQAHPPPLNCKQLGDRVALQPEEQYRQVEASPLFEPRRDCDFSQLSSQVARRLDRLEYGPELSEVRGLCRWACSAQMCIGTPPALATLLMHAAHARLQEDEAVLRSGELHGAELNEIVARMHRVRCARQA